MGYSGITSSDRKKMLETIGLNSIDELFKDIPDEIITGNIQPEQKGLSEMEVSLLLSKISKKNKSNISFIGAGSYNHYIPAAVDELSSRSEFYTAYTPYQAEVSQGTLTAIFEFQTMICQLTGMDIANASMYDGATACAESALMSSRQNKRMKILSAETLHPSYQNVLKTYAWAGDLEIEVVPFSEGRIDQKILDEMLDNKTSALILQTPNFFGCLENAHEIVETVHKAGANLIVVVTEPLSFGLIEAPGNYYADIVCGEASGLGNPPGFGGPLLGFICAKEKFTRLIPGRLAGQSLDLDGNEAFTLTLQTREQHIRRERATSNICSNEGLLVLRTAIYLSLIGSRFKELAELNHKLASYLKNSLEENGYQSSFSHPFFNEFTIYFNNYKSIAQRFKDESFIPGIDAGKFYPQMKNHIIICTTEMNSKEQIDRYIKTISSYRK